MRQRSPGSLVFNIVGYVFLLKFEIEERVLANYKKIIILLD